MRREFCWVVTLASTFFFLMFTSNGIAGEGPIIIDESAPNTDIIATKPLIGVRASSQVFVEGKLVDPVGKWGLGDYFLPEQVLIESFLTNAAFAKAVERSGLDPRALSLSALRKAGLSLRDYAYVPDTPNYDTLKFKHSTLFDTDYDSTGIIAMTGAGAFALDTYDKAGVRFREVKVFVRNLN